MFWELYRQLACDRIGGDVSRSIRLDDGVDISGGMGDDVIFCRVQGDADDAVCDTASCESVSEDGGGLGEVNGSEESGRYGCNALRILRRRSSVIIQLN